MIGRTERPNRADLPTSQQRVAALDGLRGLAILLVMMIHFAQVNPRSYHWANHVLDRFLRIGWIGVDLFFVLSGFLITGILCDARSTPHYFRNFYMRRALRIFPLYYAALFVLLVALPRVVLPVPELQSAIQNASWYWTYLVNVRTAAVGWLDGPYVGHFWSLAVEEQFYLVWPLLILAFERRPMIWCALGLTLFAVLLRIFLHVQGAPTAAYVLMPSRFDSLALGGLLALVALEPGGLERIAPLTRVGGVLCSISLAAMGIWYGRLHPEDPLVGTVGYTLLAGLFASLLVAAVTSPPASRLRRFWSSGGLVFFGRYSYGLYVVHPAVIYFWPEALSARQLWNITGTWFVAYLAASCLMGIACVGLALVSWHALEKHFLRLRFRFSDIPMRSASVANVPAIGRAVPAPAAERTG